MEVLVKPVITEQMTEQSEEYNHYAFVVNKRATKSQIKKAVEEKYDVSVTSVNTMIYGGKRKMRYTKRGIISGKTSSYKKAIVTIADGEIIDFFSNI